MRYVCQPDKVRLRGVQSRHQVVQLILVERRDRLAASLLLLAARVLHFLPGLTGMIGKNVDRKPDQDFVVIGHSEQRNCFKQTFGPTLFLVALWGHQGCWA